MNVPHNRTVAAEDFGIVINDADSDSTSCSMTISNIGSSGILTSEWSSGSAAVSYTLNPSTGTFNSATAVTYTVVITADDGTDQSTFTFYIDQAAQTGSPAPIIGVNDGASVSNGAAASGSARDFGTQFTNAGSTTAVTITVSNSGNINLTLGTPTLVGGAAGEFVLDTTGFAGVVAPATSTSFTIAFDPIAVGSFTANVEFTHNDASTTTPFSFEVTGIGDIASPVVAVNDGAAVSNGAAAAGSARDFGQQDIANGSTTAVVITVSNTAAAGAADLNPGTPSITGSGSAEFILDVTGFPATIAPGGSATFTVAFDPSSTGSFTANVEFTHDDTSTATPFSFEVTGLGTTPTPAPILTVRDTDQNGVVISNGAAASGSRNFGTVLIAGIPTANNTVYIENDGNANMTLVLPTLSGSGFTMDTSNFLTTLTPGASCSIGFALTETTGGAYSATISFAHDDSSTTTPFSFDLAGTVDDGSIDFGSGGSGGGGGGCIAADNRTALLSLLILLSSAALLYRRRKLS